MMSLGISIIFLVFSFVNIRAAEQQFNCPNNGSPKINEANGKPIQCLPGQSSEIVCGKGYSCFFSGFNYQCCPTAEEEYEHNQNECPMGSYAVLNSEGSVLRCDHKRQCPTATMFCSTLKSPVTCCEIFGTIRKISSSAEQGHKNESQKQLKKNQVKQKASSVERTTLTTANIKKVITTTTTTTEKPELTEDKPKIYECPANSIVVLTDEGQVTKCRKNNKCPGSDSFCHFKHVDNMICCQRLENLSLAVIQDVNHSNSNDSKRETQEPEKKLKTSEIEGATLEKRGPKLQRVFNNEDQTSSNNSSAKKMIVHEGYAKAKAAKIKEAELEPPTIGSNERLAKINSPPPGYNSLKTDVELKMKTQRFLVEQIKNGWPYDEKFFRPSEETEIIHKESRPTAIVHFPK